jgi:hypothetical protein
LEIERRALRIGEREIVNDGGTMPVIADFFAPLAPAFGEANVQRGCATKEEDARAAFAERNAAERDALIVVGRTLQARVEYFGRALFERDAILQLLEKGGVGYHNLSSE